MISSQVTFTSSLISEVHVPEQVGKIVRMQNRFPGPPTIAVNTIGVGLQKHLSLCPSCTLFDPAGPNHCPISDEHYQFCKAHHIGTILVRCASFVARPGVECSPARGESQ